MYYCLKIYLKKINNLYRHVQKGLTTHKRTANFNNGFFLDVRKSFLNKFKRFCEYIKNAKARELQKYIRADRAIK